MRHTKIMIGIVVVISIIFALRILNPEDGWICTDGKWVKHGEPKEAVPTSGCGDTGGVIQNNPLNISTTISGKSYMLINGKTEKELLPGSATKEVIMVFGEPVYGDLNGDGVEDAAMFLTQNSGGSGTFFFVVLAINNNGVYRGTNAMFLGDRIAPQNINIIDGRAVANFTERKPGEPITSKPSMGRSVWVHLDPNTGEIGEWVKDFEGETR